MKGIIILFLVLSAHTKFCLGQDNLPQLDSLARKYLNDSTALSVTLSQKELQLAKKRSNLNYQFSALNNLATAHLINDDYDLALEFSLDALQIAQSTGQISSLALANTTLGWLYYDVKDADESLKYHTTALQYWQRTSDSLSVCTSLNAVGLSLSLAKEFEQALPYFQKSLSMGRRLNNEERMIAAMNNIGDAWFGLGKNIEALHWLDEALPMARRHPDVLREAELQNSRAFVLTALEKYAEAKAALAQTKNLIGQSGSNARKEVSMQNALITASLFKKIKRYDSAFLAFEYYNLIHDQILSDVKKTNLMNQKAEWESKRAEREISKLREDRELRITQRNAIAVGIILLTVIGFFAYSRERQLRLKENQLAETKAALDKIELERANLEKESLQTKIDFKNKELTNYALHISQRNDLQLSFLQELESLRLKANPELLAQLNRVIRQFSNKEEISKDAEDFHANVELGNKDFFYNLQNSFPDLTENERRLCAQVRLNLSIKDIASVNGISIKAVEMARYRLRKKMNIPHEKSLYEFLSNI